MRSFALICSLHILIIHSLKLVSPNQHIQQDVNGQITPFDNYYRLLCNIIHPDNLISVMGIGTEATPSNNKIDPEIPLTSCENLKERKTIPFGAVVESGVHVGVFELAEGSEGSILHISLACFCTKHRSDEKACTDVFRTALEHAVKNQLLIIHPNHHLTREMELSFCQSFSRAQHKQDWFMYHNYFQHYPVDYKGFYLDIGANHPRSLSNTWFYDICLGWRGICVEANPAMAALLRQQRNCIVVENCVGDSSIPASSSDSSNGSSNNKTFSVIRGNHAMSYLADGNAMHEKMKLSAYIGSYETDDYTMQCTTLDDIMEQYHVKHVDYMSLDIEGYELPALRGFQRLSSHTRNPHSSISRSSRGNGNHNDNDYKNKNKNSNDEDMDKEFTVDLITSENSYHDRRYEAVYYSAGYSKVGIVAMDDVWERRGYQIPTATTADTDTQVSPGPDAGRFTTTTSTTSTASTSATTTTSESPRVLEYYAGPHDPLVSLFQQRPQVLDQAGSIWIHHYTELADTNRRCCQNPDVCATFNA